MGQSLGHGEAEKLAKNGGIQELEDFMRPKNR